MNNKHENFAILEPVFSFLKLCPENKCKSWYYLHSKRKKVSSHCSSATEIQLKKCSKINQAMELPQGGQQDSDLQQHQLAIENSHKLCCRYSVTYIKYKNCAYNLDRQFTPIQYCISPKCDRNYFLCKIRIGSLRLYGNLNLTRIEYSTEFPKGLVTCQFD